MKISLSICQISHYLYCIMQIVYVLFVTHYNIMLDVIHSVVTENRCQLHQISHQTLPAENLIEIVEEDLPSSST